MFTGTIEQLRRYPVKALRGETVRSAAVDFHGMAGDRTLGVFKPGTDDQMWGGGHPRLMAWEAAWPAQCGCVDGTGDAPVVYEPGGAAWSADESGLPGAMAADLGVESVELRKVERQYGRMLVVFASSMERLSEQMGRRIEVERFRPNVVAEADLAPFAEVDLAPGTPIRLGSGEFTVQKPCERCVLPSRDPFGGGRDMDLHRHIVRELGNHFGIYVRTDRATKIGVGDRISGRETP